MKNNESYPRFSAAGSLFLLQAQGVKPEKIKEVISKARDGLQKMNGGFANMKENIISVEEICYNYGKVTAVAKENAADAEDAFMRKKATYSPKILDAGANKRAGSCYDQIR